MGIKITAVFVGFAALLCLVALSASPASKVKVLSAYETSLEGRTPNQRFNAERAVRYINGTVMLPGTTFSFNNHVGGWSGQQGYRRAPVSYNGVLVDEYGGGVCQTSTTLYNAALLAGLKIIERHSHTFAPGYVPAGRDAAVAYQNVDLRFQNPYTFPVVMHATVHDGFLICAVTSRDKPALRATVVSKILDVFPAPKAPPEPGAGYRRSRWHLEGRPGVRVATYRCYYATDGSLIMNQLVSDNTYRGISAASWTNRAQ